MEITAQMVKELRELTHAGMLDCKKALEAAEGDFEKAIEILRKKGLAIAAKKAEREAKEGLIEAYVHAGSRVAALIELNCETDFVARTPQFKELAHNLAMQVVGARPRYIRKEDVPEEVLESEKRSYRTQIEAEGQKPAPVVERLIEGMLDKFYEETCLMEQPFIKDGAIKIKDLIAAKIAELGENIVVRRFTRYELGE